MKGLKRAIPVGLSEAPQSVRAVALSAYPRQPGLLVHEVDTHLVLLNYIAAE